MTIRMIWVSVLFFAAGFSSTLCAERADSIQGIDGALIVVLSNGEAATGQVAAELGASGNSLIHVIAGDAQEVAKINSEVARAGLKGIVSVEALGLTPLPYRDDETTCRKERNCHRRQQRHRRGDRVGFG